MTERDNLTNPEKSQEYAQTMKKSANELETLRTELQNLMVRSGLRALRLYQSGTPEPLKPMDISRLVKYELDNVAADIVDPKNKETIIQRVKAEWEKQKSK